MRKKSKYSFTVCAVTSGKKMAGQTVKKGWTHQISTMHNKQTNKITKLLSFDLRVLGLTKS